MVLMVVCFVDEFLAEGISFGADSGEGGCGEMNGGGEISDLGCLGGGCLVGCLVGLSGGRLNGCRDGE